MGVCNVSRIGNIVYCSDLSWREHVFADRFEGGVILGRLLKELGYGARNTVVFGLVAGGAPVAYMVARELNAPLDIIVVKKILYPWTTEAGFGAVAVDGSFDYDEFIAHSYLGYGKPYVRELARRVHEYVYRRTLKLRGSVEYPSLKGYTAILVDDGIATGYTMVVGLRFLRRIGADKVIAAAPTSCTDGAEKASLEANEVIVLNLRNPPYAVADAYREWHDVSDEEVLEILGEAKKYNLYPPPWLKRSSP